MAGNLRDRALRRRGLLALLAYGLIVAAVGSVLLSRSLPEGKAWPVLGGRLTELQATFAAVEDGDPPLIARTTFFDRFAGGANNTSQKYRIVGQGDDPGMFVAAPLVAKWLGLIDVREAIKWIYLALVALALVSYPLVFHRITGSVRAALVAPLVLLDGLLALDGLIIDSYSDVSGDVYWVLAWVSIALLPPLLLLARERNWGRWGVPALLGLALLAGIASIFRLNAGLPFVVAGALVVLLRRSWSWPQRGIVLAALLAAYALVVPAGMSALRQHSEDWASQRGGIQPLTTTTPVFWHSVYIGSGYLPNDDLIIYRDEVGFTRAQERNPDVVLLSPEYDSIVRDLFFDEVRADPLAIAWQALRKATVVIRATAWLLFAVTFFLTASFFIRREHGLPGWALVIAIPGVLLGLLTGLLVIPDAQYVLAWTGSLLFLLVVGVCAVVAELEGGPSSWLAARRAERSSLDGRLPRSRPERIVAAVAALVVFLTLAGAAAGARVYNDFQVWWTNSAGTADLAAREAAERTPQELAAHKAARTAAERTPQELAAQTSVRFGVQGPKPALPKGVALDGLSGSILSDYDPFTNGADLTVEGWARRKSTETDDALFGSTSGELPAFVRIAAGSGDVQFFPANGYFSTWPGAWPDTGKWVHWAFVFDQGESTSDYDDARLARLYIDGQLKGEMAQSQGFDHGYGNFIAGSYAWIHSDPFDGDLAGVAVFERALSEEEIGAHAAAGKRYLPEVSKARPDLLWRLGEAGGLDAHDSSGSGHDGLYAWAPRRPRRPSG